MLVGLQNCVGISTWWKHPQTAYHGRLFSPGAHHNRSLVAPEGMARMQVDLLPRQRLYQSYRRNAPAPIFHTAPVCTTLTRSFALSQLTTPKSAAKYVSIDSLRKHTMMHCSMLLVVGVH